MPFCHQHWASNQQPHDCQTDATAQDSHISCSTQKIIRGWPFNNQGVEDGVVLKKIVLIFSEKNKMIWIFSETKFKGLWKKYIYSLTGPYLHILNMKINETITRSAKQIIRFVAEHKKINNSDVKTLPHPLDIKWSAPRPKKYSNII